MTDSGARRRETATDTDATDATDARDISDTSDTSDTADPPAPTLLDQMGGIGGLASSVLPVVVFVVVNSLVGLSPAIWSALGSAVAIGVWRLARRERLQPAVSAVLGVGICVFIAYYTGEARGFYLYGIWYSLVAGVAFVASIAARWPLVGVLWSVLDGTGFGWRADRRSRSGYDLATGVWAVFFFARFGVQHWLYIQHAAGWLGVARLLMGLPLTAVALLVTIWAIRRARAAVAA